MSHMSHSVRVQDCMRPGALAVALDDSADATFARTRGACLEAIPVVNEHRVIGLVEDGAAYACQSGGIRSGSVPVASLMFRGLPCLRKPFGVGQPEAVAHEAFAARRGTASRDCTGAKLFGSVRGSD